MKLNLLFNNFSQTQDYLTHFLKPDTSFFFYARIQRNIIRVSKLIMESLVTNLPKIPASIGQLTIKRQESLKQRHPGSHDASIGDEAGATKSLDFLNKEYDNLVKFRKQAEERISAMKKSLAVISSRVNNLPGQSIKPRNTVICILSSLLVFRRLSRVKMPLKRHSSV